MFLTLTLTLTLTLNQARQQQRVDELAQIRGDAIAAEWGQQIRSYVLAPYKMVKDLRSGHETPQVADVLDGKLSRSGLGLHQD